MLLAVDVRNRMVTLGFHDGGAWLSVRRFGAWQGRTADDYALFARLAAGQLPAPDRAWISSVVPALTPVLVEAIGSAFGITARIIGPGVRTGMKVRTDLPGEVGSDLICASVAAWRLVEGPLVVADFGVALAMSAVNASGEFMGAAIVPGLEAAAAVLREQAAQIPEIRLEVPMRAIGRSTVESVRAGIMVGYSGLVERLFRRMAAELDPDSGNVALLGTGDPTGRTILESCGPHRFVPDLCLEGIALIDARSVP